MNKYRICVSGVTECFIINADRIIIENNIYKLIIIDQLKNREIVVGYFPIDKTAIEKV